MRYWRLLASLALAWATTAAAEDLDGKKLYLGVAACAACHQPDGRGLPKAVPSLEKSPWVTESKDRLIRIVLHGLAGPIMVSGKQYDSMMPPHAHLSDAQVAAVLTYVRSSFGNDADAVTTAEVAAVRALNDDPGQPWTTAALLKKYPFDKKFSRSNGLPRTSTKLDPVAMREITEIEVVRTWLPGSTPASIAIALPGPQYLVWDAGICAFRYVWQDKGFLHDLKRHWSSNGKPVARIEGTPYFSLPPGRPLRFGSATADPPESDYHGYELVDANPHLRYGLGKAKVKEWFTTTAGGKGLQWHLQIENAPAAIFVRLGQQAANMEVNAGTIADGVWSFSPADAAKGVAMTMTPGIIKVQP